jgi:hypothetical protein
MAKRCSGYRKDFEVLESHASANISFVPLSRHPFGCGAAACGAINPFVTPTMSVHQA